MADQKESQIESLKESGVNKSDLEKPVHESAKDEKRRLERLKNEVEYKESELKATRSLALQIVESGQLIVKIDGEATKDLMVPCPDCGACIEGARAAVHGLASAVLRQAGGDIVRLGVGQTLPCVVGSFRCPKCGAAHGITACLVF